MKRSKPTKCLLVARLDPGFDDAALVGALDRANIQAVIFDDEKYVAPRWGGDVLLRSARKVLRPRAKVILNKDIQEAIRFVKPELVLIFGGAGINRDLIDAARGVGAVVAFYYPDMTIDLPGNYPTLWNDVDYSFTNKPNWRSLHNANRITKTPAYLPLWYDPRFVGPYRANVVSESDILFVGHQSQFKEQFIRAVSKHFAHTNSITLIGRGWNHLRESGMRVSPVPLYGDYPNGLYAKAKITLGLLEQLDGGASDEITARTIQVPAYGGFMLHPRTPGAVDIFGDQQWMFRDQAGLLDLIAHYLDRPAERERSQQDAATALIPSFSVDHALNKILDHCGFEGTAPLL